MGMGAKVDGGESECETVRPVDPVGYGSISVPAQKPKPKFTAKKIKILASVVYGNLFLGSCYSLMAPFFPAEAERKGASATEYGLVFGIYQLVMFLASPVHGKLVPILQPGFLLKAGMLVSGICSVLFGTLNYAPEGRIFVSLAFLVRIVDAIGASAFLTASYTILGYEFPEIIGRAMSIAETAFSFGLAIGPVIGGFLYGLGGFGAPFYTVGALLLSGTFVNFFLFSNAEKGKPQKPGKATAIMADFDFCMDMLTIVICFTSLGFNEATLEPHIRQFQLSAQAIGGIFLIEGLVDACTAFVWGFFAEKVSNAQYFTIVAVCLFIVCFLLVGPAPFLPFPTMLWVIIVSQVLLGFGMAGEIVCSFTHGIKNTVERGFPEDVATYGMVSGILFSSACLGGFAGPSAGGFLVDHFGYKNATLFILGIQVLTLCLLSGRMIWRCIRRRRKQSVDTNQLENSKSSHVENST